MNRIDPNVGLIKKGDDDSWIGVLDLYGKKIDFILYEDGETISHTLENLANPINKLKTGEYDYKSRLIEDLLDLYNKSWRPEGKARLTKNDFMDIVKLTNINLYGAGSIILWFDDGDLFAGHNIQVRINAQGELRKAKLSG